MKRISGSGLVAVLLAFVAVAAPASESAAVPVGYAFTYQGSLKDSGVNADGPYDFRFTLYDAASGGTAVSATVEVNDLAVSGGLFTTELDFGSAPFTGAQVWLQVEVRQGGSTGGYTVLPRQKLTPTPFAVGLSLPVLQGAASDEYLLRYFNAGAGGCGLFYAGGTATNYALYGMNASTGFNAAGVIGDATGATGGTVGVEGRAIASPQGTGILARGNATGAYVKGEAGGSTGLYAYGKALGAVIQGEDPGSIGLTVYGYGKGILAQNLGTGPAAFLTGKGKMFSDATLRVENTETDQGMSAYIHNNSNFATAHFQNDNTGQILWLESHGGGDYIVATSGTELKFWVDGSGVTHTNALEILGGADLSERFDVDDQEKAIEPGTVVSIDTEHEGSLVVTSKPYDRRVAGIISGAGGVSPGLLLGHQGTAADGAHPVALTGRVYCFATASNGAIAPGDLLTTSAVPGYAMRVDDPVRAQGAILGKSMGTLKEGEGLILVLVGLQ